MGQFIHQSVSCVITVNQRVLLLKRAQTLRHFPGYWALPGGKIESSDPSAEEALCRELLEELSLVVKPESLRRIGKCLTPRFAPYRFENQIYHLALELDAGLDVEIDQDSCEVSHHILNIILNEEHEKFEYVSIEGLDHFFSRIDVLCVPMLPWACQMAFSGGFGDFSHQYLDRKEDLLKASYVSGILTYIVPSRSLPPSKHTNVLVIDNWLIDPSPKKVEHVDLLISSWRDCGVNSIFISHWHLDHHENLALISQALKAKVFMSEMTKYNIENHWGEDYFQNIEVEILVAGQLITCENTKEKMKVLDHPGHADGQLGLEHIGGAWCFVGDVFQGVGSVVVENMSAYMDCLFDLIENSSQKRSRGEDTIFIPSHGLPIGGNQVLKNIYEHRLKRERQVEKLLEINLNSDQILNRLYPQLSIELQKYALKNINGHIQRILSRRKS